jgi:hypothetical protein
MPPKEIDFNTYSILLVNTAYVKPIAKGLSVFTMEHLSNLVLSEGLEIGRYRPATSRGCRIFKPG